MPTFNVKKSKLKLPKARKKLQRMDIHLFRGIKVGTNYTYIVLDTSENVLKG
jgi:hypothetical protein